MSSLKQNKKYLNKKRRRRTINTKKTPDILDFDEFLINYEKLKSKGEDIEKGILK